jgi:hypothetical protein
VSRRVSDALRDARVLDLSRLCIKVNLDPPNPKPYTISPQP